MKITQLRYFCSIIEHGGFIAASRELNIAQPALSRRIFDLEKSLGCQLLVRGPGGTKMTDPGQKFYVHAKSILERIEAARTDIQSGNKALKGAVSIAMPFGLASQLAAPVIRDVGEEHAGIEVRIEDGLGYQAGQAVDAANVDFGILANVGNLQNAAFEPVLEENLFLFIKRNGKSANTNDIALNSVQDIGLVMPNRKVHVRRNLENTMIRIGCHLNVSYEQQSLLTIRNMVRAGIGATVMNWPSLSDLWHSGELDGRRIVDPVLTRTVCLAIPNARPLSATATAVYEIARHTMIKQVESGDWKSGKVIYVGS